MEHSDQEAQLRQLELMVAQQKHGNPIAAPESKRHGRGCSSTPRTTTNATATTDETLAQMAGSQQNQHVKRPVTTPPPVLNTDGIHLSVLHPDQNALTNGDLGNLNRQPGQSFAIRPLPKETFNASYYQNFLPRIGKDQALLMLDNWKVDLYQLHCEVTNAGGVTRVNENVVYDSCPIIGARLGFVHIPGTDTEPARSGSGLALRLQAIYKDFFLGFDRQYFIMMARRQQQMMNATQLTNSNTENGLASQGGANEASGQVYRTSPEDIIMLTWFWVAHSFME
ncbi:hypothetical protein C8Q79DRAFT_1007469 [Trametes meyenii]|nr:hypothetical protein C8Q79DRAFT_1007469 [Trametes meyenii]